MEDLIFDPEIGTDNPLIEGDTNAIEFPESSDGVTNVGVVRGNLAIVDDYNRGDGQDAYQFEVEGSRSYNVELENLEADLNLSINDSEGNTLYSSSESGNESEFIAADFEPGIYTANIMGEEDAQTSYSFSITETSSQGESNSDNNRTENDSEPILNEGDVVYRFLETEGETQFYTTSEVERDAIIEDLPNYEYEGESFVGAPNSEAEDITGVVPVYRFFNVDTGVHLYTASEVEREAVAELPNYNSEGISYYGYESQQEGSVPLYRFYNPSLDAHFYTPSVAERDEFLASSEYQPEGGESGIAYYVQPVDM